MKIEIAQHGRMSESGSSLLRLIQNQDMPLLDLLVREAVQNSLDASNGREFVNVDFSVKQFKAKELNKIFEKITDQLNARFNGSIYNSVIISDSNTVGLTGPVKYEDVKGQDFGNCLKLIYEISKPQLREGAGGSWGLGKTIYFRIGFGLVIYYSRIEQNGKYKSRLAACLVEDETKSGSLIPSLGGVKRGIAWWGAESSTKKTTVPIEDEHEIKRILSVFNINPYRDGETGTVIIIPYIDDNKLLQEVYEKNEDQNQKPYWTTSIDEYFRIAIQRWYAPRILNTSYNGAFLRPSVNNSLIKVNTLLPLFKVIRELYICATTGKLPEDSLLSEAKVNYQVDEIRIREVFVHGTSSAGKFAYLKMTDKQLMMTPPDNQKSPYQQITNRAITMENGNNPIVVFTRKPGMIVGYDYNGVWTHRMPKSGEADYIIGLFVANSNNKLVDIYDSANNHLTLEEYIRQGEKADHASWSDRNIGGANPRVISKVQNGIIKTIISKFKEKPAEAVERKNIGLSHALANILLPSNDFGHRSSSGGNGAGGGGGSGSTSGGKPSITIGSQPTFRNGSILFSYEASVRKGNNDIRLSIITDYKKYDSETWESEIGRQFPIAFSGFSISNRKRNNQKGAWEKVSVVLNNSSVTYDDMVLNSVPSIQNRIVSCIRISSENNYRLKGQIEIVSKDPSLKVTIDIKEVQK